MDSDLKTIKNRILSKALFKKEEDLGDLLQSMSNKYPDVDFSDYDIVLETRLISEDTDEALGLLDKSPVSINSHVDSKGNLRAIGDRHIHFIDIMFKTKDGENGPIITLSALPNINNPNVAKQQHVKQFLNE